MNPPLELYWFSGSPFAWRVQLLLHLKGVDYISHRLDPTKQEHKTPEYLAINPRGKVPALKQGDFVMRESLAMLAYLSAQNPEWQLFGTTPQEQGLVWQQMTEIDGLMVPQSRPLIVPIFFNKVAGQETSIQEAAQAIALEFQTLNNTLSDRPWLMGSQLTAADITAYPLIKFIERMVQSDLVAHLDLGLLPYQDTLPHMQAWIERLEALPGAMDSFPPHWR